MGKRTVYFNAVRAPRGRVIHAASKVESSRTACGRQMLGWVASVEDVLGCEACKLAILRVAVHEGEELS